MILEHLKYQVVKGTIAEIRDRTMRVLKGCGVEMLILDMILRKAAIRALKKLLGSTSDGSDRSRALAVSGGTVGW